MSWENAPRLNKLAATQLLNKNGAQVWGVDYKGTLYTNYQLTPGGDWAGWKTKSKAEGGCPQPVYELCASQQHGGEGQLWVLDFKRQLWTIRQNMDGSWTKWDNNWNKPPGSFQFKKMAAVWQGVSHGARFWGLTENGVLTSCAQHMPAGNWGAWADWPGTPHDFIEVTSCTLGDGKAALFALDNTWQLWAMFQQAPGGQWGQWVGPNCLEAPKLRNIVAVEETVERHNEKIHGASLIGITQDFEVIFNEQSRPSANWFGWSVISFKNELRGYELTAARQNNQSARVWVVGNNGDLVSQQVNINSSPPSWERYWTPDE